MLDKVDIAVSSTPMVEGLTCDLVWQCVHECKFACQLETLINSKLTKLMKIQLHFWTWTLEFNIVLVNVIAISGQEIYQQMFSSFSKYKLNQIQI